MEENKKERTLEDVQREYFNVAAKAGEAQYRIGRVEEDLRLFNKQLLDLNLEAAALQAKAAAARAESKNV